MATEHDKINLVLGIGREIGYGNLIAHLRRAWADMLVSEHGLTDDVALLATEVDAYPVDIELRRKLDRMGR